MANSDQSPRRNVYTREQVKRVMAATDDELFNPQHADMEIVRARSGGSFPSQQPTETSGLDRLASSPTPTDSEASRER